MYTIFFQWRQRGRVAHICVGNLPIIDSDDGLSPSRHQAIIWTNTGILLIWRLWTNVNESLIAIHFDSRKCIWKRRLRNGGHFVSASMCYNIILSTCHFVWYYTAAVITSQVVGLCYPDSKVHGANMGPIWGRQDPGGPHVGPMNFATLWKNQEFSTWILNSSIGCNCCHKYSPEEDLLYHH